MHRVLLRNAMRASVYTHTTAAKLISVTDFLCGGFSYKCSLVNIGQIYKNIL